MSLEQTQQRRQAVSTIHDIVGAMRAIAAGRIQGAQRALAGARRYEEVVERALAALPEPPLPPRPGKPVLLLAAMSEQPLCGSFNHNLFELVERRRRELAREGEVRLAVVGQRGRRLLAAHGLTPDETEPAATSLHGLRDLVKRLAARVGPRYAAGELGAVHVLYSRYQSVSEQIPTEERILPPDLARVRRLAPPREQHWHRYLGLPELTAGLVGEYAFISLYRIAADSFASEQAARLIAMDSATRNTERLLESLLDLERRERQGEITRQVLELIGAHFTAEDLDEP
jgi:F-type H+-transporting ATPase subunit gamma